MVASDGRQLLVQAGYSLPWKDDVLIPALPAFASRGLAGQQNVRLGRQGKLLLLEAGPWLLRLPVEGARGFPYVGKVIPAAQGNVTRLHLDAEDVRLLLEKLPGMPGHDEHDALSRSRVPVAGAAVAWRRAAGEPGWRPAAARSAAWSSRDGR